MNAGKHTGFEIAIAAVVLGIAGDSLLRSVPWGLNLPAMAALGIAAIAILKFRTAGAFLSLRRSLILAAALFFASWFAIRDSEPLLFLNVLAMLLLGAMFFLPSVRLPVKGSGLIHYAFSGITMVLSMALLPAVVLTKDLRWNSLVRSGGSKKVMLAVRGILIATPLVLIFGALFAAADAAFEGMVTNVFDVVPETLAQHAFFTALFAWPAAGLLRAVTLGISLEEEPAGTGKGDENRDFSEGGIESVTESTKDEASDPPAFGTRHIPSVTESEEAKPEEEAESEAGNSGVESKASWSWKDLNNSILPDFLTVGSTEVGIVLGSLNLLFFLFVLFQLPYLFGGMELVQTQPGLKLAEYARRGFGELFFASVLVLPVLLALHWLIRRESERAMNLFRYLAAMQIGLLFVIMMSAFQRMLLLTGELGYGMTLGRFFPMAFMIWLAVVFLLFGYTVLRGERGKFAFSAAVSALAMVAVLNFVNPEDYVVRTNLELMKEGREFDAGYNSSLSADAVPAMMKAYPELNEVQKDIVLGNLVWRECRNPLIDDLRVWNHSRQKAAEASRVVSEYIERNGCG